MFISTFAAAIISMILIIVSYVPYFSGMIKGKTRPNPATWLSWIIMMAAMWAVLFFSNGGDVLWPTGLIFFINVAVFVLAIKQGTAVEVVKIDVVCFIISLVAFVFWLITRESDSAMVLITMAQTIAFIPTVRKAWSKPYEENPFTWGLNGLRYTIMILSVAYFSIATVFNLAWWAVVNILMTAFILIRRRVVDKQASKK